MARKASIEKKLADRIRKLEEQIMSLEEQLEAAKQNHSNYLTHQGVIESILSLQTGDSISKPKRKYTRRQKV